MNPLKNASASRKDHSPELLGPLTEFGSNITHDVLTAHTVYPFYLHTHILRFVFQIILITISYVKRQDAIKKEVSYKFLYRNTFNIFGVQETGWNLVSECPVNKEARQSTGMVGTWTIGSRSKNWGGMWRLASEKQTRQSGGAKMA